METRPAHSDAACAHIALGSNVGDRAAHLHAAIGALRSCEGIEVIAVSGWIETEPVGQAGQGLYLNGACAVGTTLAPRELLDTLLGIERTVGRDRREETVRWGPRILDLDLLLYEDTILDEPGLTLPHPMMHTRAFVLEPLAAIAPDARHPVLGVTVSELLARLGRKVD